MEVNFEHKKLQKICEDEKQLKMAYGKIQAKEIIKRISELISAENLYDISRLPQARLHKLYNNWKGHFAVDIKHPYRLILLPLNDGSSNKKSITKIKIIDIIDYH